MNCFYSFPVALVSLQFPVFSLTAQMKHCNSTVSECNSTHCRTNSVQDSWSTSNQLWQADEFEIQAHCQAKQYCRMSARSSNPAMGKKKKLEKGESSYKRVLKLLRDRRRLSLRHQAATRQAAGTLFYSTPNVSVRVTAVYRVCKRKRTTKWMLSQEC